MQRQAKADSESLTKRHLAERLGVSRGTLYYQPKRQLKDDELRLQIAEVMYDNPGYGHRRIAIKLGINKKCVRRIMRLFNLKPARRCRQRPHKADDVGKSESEFRDVLSVFSPIEPHIAWVADFTYIPFHGRIVYLATVLDFFTREVLGVKIMLRHTSELVLAAFLDAKERSQRVPEYLHSDQGSEYLSGDVLRVLQSYGIQPSNSPKGSPWRNARQESFFGRFKVEFGDPERFKTLPELIEEIYRQISYYNTRRIFTDLRMAPVPFREKWLAQTLELSKKNPHHHQKPNQLNTTHPTLYGTNAKSSIGTKDTPPLHSPIPHQQFTTSIHRPNEGTNATLAYG